VTGAILVANVDRDVREIFTIVLRHAGYAVRQITDAEQIAHEPEQVVHEAVDCALVITEYSQPPAPGAAVTAALRADGRTRSVKILNATTYVLSSELAAARAAGVDANILLPAPLAELLAHVYALIGPPSPHNERRAGAPGDQA
jgi:CheY-like chemotaxis protein